VDQILCDHSVTYAYFCGLNLTTGFIGHRELGTPAVRWTKSSVITLSPHTHCLIAGFIGHSDFALQESEKVDPVNYSVRTYKMGIKDKSSRMERQLGCVVFEH